MWKLMDKTALAVTHSASLLPEIFRCVHYKYHSTCFSENP